MKKYTLDRIENDMYVFLERPDEIETMLIPRRDCPEELLEGDIVEIESVRDGYTINVLKEETKITRDKVRTLLDKLKKK
ncbi:DUF3006 domain-containing protein [Lederbergia citrisecunda]|uniref:DUF3006 domain-containing protein n=1 Tax=Lederbergia citrisecunda TaxID=2833583 RepID=UPI003D265DDB